MQKRKLIPAAAALLAVLLLTAACGGTRHSLVYVPGREATCEQSGVLEHWHCSACGQDFADKKGRQQMQTVTVPAPGHDPTAFEVTLTATCRREGEMVRRCTRCQWSEKVVLPKTGHNWQDNVCTVCKLDCSPTDGLAYSPLIREGQIAGWEVSLGEATDRDIILSHSYRGLPVLSIAEKGFYGSNVRRVAVYADLERVGAQAFERCIFLEEFVLPDSVRELGTRAFYDCTQMKLFGVGAGLETLGDSALWNCYRLEEIRVDEKNKTFSDEGNCLFELATKTVVAGTAESRIPDGTEVIANYAFLRRQIRELVLPKSVKRIGGSAFFECTLLERLVYGGSESEWENVEKGSNWNAHTAAGFHVEFAE